MNIFNNLTNWWTSTPESQKKQETKASESEDLSDAESSEGLHSTETVAKRVDSTVTRRFSENKLSYEEEFVQSAHTPTQFSRDFQKEAASDQGTVKLEAGVEKLKHEIVLLKNDPKYKNPFSKTRIKVNALSRNLVHMQADLDFKRSLNSLTKNFNRIK